MSTITPDIGTAALDRGTATPDMRTVAFAKTRNTATLNEISDTVTTTLNTLRPGETGRVTAVAGPTGLRRRLLELGLTPGAVIRMLRFAPMGDPIAIEIRGYHLSLRKREAKGVTLIKL